MTDKPAGFNLVHQHRQAVAAWNLSGDWVQGCAAADFDGLCAALEAQASSALVVDGASLGQWDSTLMAFLLQCHTYCRREQLAFAARNLPDSAGKLLALATAVERPYTAATATHAGTGEF